MRAKSLSPAATFLIAAAIAAGLPARAAVAGVVAPAQATEQEAADAAADLLQADPASSETAQPVSWQADGLSPVRGDAAEPPARRLSASGRSSPAQLGRLTSSTLTSLTYGSIGFPPSAPIAIPVFWGPHLPDLEELGALVGIASGGGGEVPATEAPLPVSGPDPESGAPPLRRRPSPGRGIPGGSSSRSWNDAGSFPAVSYAIVGPVRGASFFSGDRTDAGITLVVPGLFQLPLAPPPGIPEPLTVSLLALGAMGAAGLGSARRRRRAAS